MRKNIGNVSDNWPSGSRKDGNSLFFVEIDSLIDEVYFKYEDVEKHCKDKWNNDVKQKIGGEEHLIAIELSTDNFTLNYNPKA